MAAKNVRCNVEDHRLFDGGVKVEDITSVSLPTVEHPTTTVKASGMVMDVDIPNMHHYNAMEFEVSHNNGNNCPKLAMPGIHNMEFRIARQNYNVQLGQIDLELVKVRIIGAHKSTEKGSIETDNPYGSTEKYSVLRYEEEIDGETTLLIDSMAGKNEANGESFSDSLSALLD
ncbi:MAG: phage major tail tube protein [Clostridia bacterium]|nr:phage major tail tube protein [Clostridia bacterium]